MPQKKASVDDILYLSKHGKNSSLPIKHEKEYIFASAELDFKATIVKEGILKTFCQRKKFREIGYTVP